MTDEVDFSNDNIQHDIERRVEDVRRNAELPPGEPGDCERCGEWSGRLVNGVCAPCRDLFKLP